MSYVYCLYVLFVSLCNCSIRGWFVLTICLLNLLTDIVTENQAPVFILTPQRQQAVIGEPVYLHCAANGPDHLGNPPRIVWLKDGVTVDFRYL